MVERHARRSLPVRIAASVTGAVLGILAVPLAVPLPELGLPLLAIALRLLGLQFDWAHRLNVRLDTKVREARRSIVRYLRQGFRRLRWGFQSPRQGGWRNPAVVTLAGVVLVLGIVLVNLIVNLIL